MEEIKVGEYVRTVKGEISKVTDTDVGETPKGDVLLIELDKKEYTEIGSWIKKHSFNMLDLIEDEDIAVLEYKPPKYKQRVTRRFEVFKIDDDIRFENAHCNFHCKIGDKRITDTICKNIKVKSIVTKEQFKNIEYKVGGIKC